MFFLKKKKNEWEAEMTGDFGTILAPLGFVSSWQMVPGVQEYDKNKKNKKWRHFRNTDAILL